MNSYGYHARLTVAAIAAVSLHGIILYGLSPTIKQASSLDKPIEVELLKAQANAHTAPATTEKHIVAQKKQAQRILKPFKEKQIVIKSKQYHKKPHVDKHAAIAVAAVQHKKELKHVSVTDNEALKEPPVKEAHKGATTIPKRLQMHILAQVHYPKQARRHGWQGRVELQLDIQRQSIQNVTLLASSGYSILDRAASRGVGQVKHIPLSNGLYRMPITFRLQ